MMQCRRLYLLALLILGAGMPWLAHAGGWPTHVTFANGTKLGVNGTFQYDWAAFTDDRLPDGRRLFDDTLAWRAQSLSAYLKRPKSFEIVTGYGFAGNVWLGNYVSFHTPAGKFRVGEFRTLVGWESGTTLGEATSFMESALPVLLIDEGRRAGIGWTYTGFKHFTLQAQWFAPHDLNHNGDGRSIVGRVVYAPIKKKSDVFHFGFSASREPRESHQARFNAKPETHLTPVHLVDTGTLNGVNHIERAAFEFGWMNGPWLVQGEYLGLRASRTGAPDFHTHGGFVALSWMATGESRIYKNTAFVDPKWARRWGAVELGLRYSRVDLDDGPVLGGVEHDWTFGIDWYITVHLKLQAQDIYAVAERGDLPVSPHIYELRAQIKF